MVRRINIFRVFFLCAFVMAMPKLSFAEKVFFFEGQIDFSKNEFTIIFHIDDNSSIAATAQKISETDYRFVLDIEHLKTPFFDLLSKIESSIEVIHKKNAPEITFVDTIFRGRVWSRYSLVDYKPVEELTGSFEIKEQRLQVTALSFGNLTCNGYIDLVSPYGLDLTVNLMGVDMNDFLNFWSSNKKYESSGAITGEIKASGTFGNLALRGKLESRHGFVQKLHYDIISLNIEGIYPHMQIAQSTISKSDGVTFSLEGPFNLRDKTNFKKQIKALTLMPLVSDSGSELEWTIKRLSLEDSGITELKYRFRKGNILGIGTSIDDEADMFGLERTRKF